MANKIASHAAPVLAQARRNLDVLREQHTTGPVTSDFDEWESLLDGPVETLLATLVSVSQRAVGLRQNSPFAGVLVEDERADVLAAFRRSFGRRGASP